MAALEATIKTIAQKIPADCLTLIETTVAPGTTEFVAWPIMKKAFAARGIKTEPLLAHWGGGLLFREASPAARPGLANVVYDTAASPLCYDDRIWRAALDVVPPSKVIFGSDYPLILYPKTEAAPGWGRLLAEIGSAGLTVAESGPLLAGNAARLLRL